MRKPGGASGMIGHVGDEGARSQGEANGLSGAGDWKA